MTPSPLTAVRAAEREAADRVAAARAEADEITDQARADAERMLEEARTRIAREREELLAAGREAAERAAAEVRVESVPDPPADLVDRMLRVVLPEEAR